MFKMLRSFDTFIISAVQTHMNASEQIKHNTLLLRDVFTLYMGESLPNFLIDENQLPFSSYNFPIFVNFLA